MARTSLLSNLPGLLHASDLCTFRAPGQLRGSYLFLQPVQHARPHLKSCFLNQASRRRDYRFGC